jgi:hypothetical protein
MRFVRMRRVHGSGSGRGAQTRRVVPVGAIFKAWSDWSIRSNRRLTCCPLKALRALP